MADYLPGDLLAVPAYAEVGFLVAAAAAAGAHSLNIVSEASFQSRYPIMLGNDFQLDFRHHPMLGTVGVFSQYGQPSRSHDQDCNPGQEDSSQSGNIRPEPDPVVDQFRQSVKVAAAILHATGHVFRWSEREGISYSHVLDVKHRTEFLDQPWLILAAQLIKIDDLLLSSIIPTCFGESNVLLWLLEAYTWANGIPSTFPVSTVFTQRQSVLSLLGLFYSCWRGRRASPNPFPGSVSITTKGPESWITVTRIDHHTSASHVGAVTSQALDDILEAIDGWETPGHNMNPFTSMTGWRNNQHEYHSAIQSHPIMKDLGEVFMSGLEKKKLCRMVSCGRPTFEWGIPELESPEFPVGPRNPALQEVSDDFGDDQRFPSRARRSTAEGTSNVDIKAAESSKIQPGSGLPNTAKQDVSEGCIAQPDIKHEGVRPNAAQSDITDGQLDIRHKGVLPDAKQTEMTDDQPTAASRSSDEAHTDQSDEPPPKQFRKIKFDKDETRTEEEILDDVLVWRAILVVALCSTAPDNSEILKSGLWEQIVPVL
ncbi:hypothetical protein QBC36DRAFT_316418 [Triangularia setosa]|uniref:Uncharacterized protein n=1 Tax=Triangularia setosa TaxID=2587417 RepID=A0AAN7A276_9PEZI|nr:hypothetical protein QBC36DRAFT_316418 [Podospora setosa]